MEDHIEVLSEEEACRKRLLHMTQEGYGSIRKIEIQRGQCTISAAVESELCRFNSAHGGYFRSYTYDAKNWNYRDRQNFLRLTDKAHIVFFIVLYEEGVRVFTTKSDAV